jgi:creatinine amidohydrolase
MGPRPDGLDHIKEVTMRSKEAQRRAPLPVRWDELTASDFPRAVKQAKGVCVLPIGCIEKHGPHLPLGTDTMAVRAASVRAAEREYAVVFPEYYFGQILEARHQPGCVGIRPDLMNELLQNVCDEIGRNGFDRILLVNGHGGNTFWLQFFCQAQIAERRDYVVFYTDPSPRDAETIKRIEAMQKTKLGGHACECETSWMMVLRPDLVQLGRAGDESGERVGKLDRLKEQNLYSGISWYAAFPNHYAGDARPAASELGELFLSGMVDSLASVIRALKRDRVALRLQTEFCARTDAPSATSRPAARRR